MIKQVKNMHTDTNELANVLYYVYYLYLSKILEENRSNGFKIVAIFF